MPPIPKCSRCGGSLEPMPSGARDPRVTLFCRACLETEQIGILQSHHRIWQNQVGRGLGPLGKGKGKDSGKDEGSGNSFLFARNRAARWDTYWRETDPATATEGNNDEEAEGKKQRVS